MTEQRKFPLVYQTVNGVHQNVYTGRTFPIKVELDKWNADHACNRCEVDDCEFRGHAYNLGCEPGIDCLATK